MNSQIADLIKPFKVVARLQPTGEYATFQEAFAAFHSLFMEAVDTMGQAAWATYGIAHNVKELECWMDWRGTGALGAELGLVNPDNHTQLLSDVQLSDESLVKIEATFVKAQFDQLMNVAEALLEYENSHEPRLDVQAATS